MKKYKPIILFIFLWFIILFNIVQLFFKVHDNKIWVGASHFKIPINDNKNGALIQYGYELIAHTSLYLGPKGSVQHTTNGMNCQNCHLEAGTKPWGLNYGAVFSTYPKLFVRLVVVLIA